MVVSLKTRSRNAINSIFSSQIANFSIKNAFSAVHFHPLAMSVSIVENTLGTHCVTDNVDAQEMTDARDYSGDDFMMKYFDDMEKSHLEELDAFDDSHLEDRECTGSEISKCRQIFLELSSVRLEKTRQFKLVFSEMKKCLQAYQAE